MNLIFICLEYSNRLFQIISLFSIYFCNLLTYKKCFRAFHRENISNRTIHGVSHENLSVSRKVTVAIITVIKKHHGKGRENKNLQIEKILSVSKCINVFFLSWEKCYRVCYP